MADERLTRQALINAREKASEIDKMAHVGFDVKSVVKDLLQVAENFRALMDEQPSMSADVRVLRKKLDLSTRRLEDMKKMIISLATEIEMVNVEAGKVLKRHMVGADEDGDGARRIQECAKRIVDVVMQLSKSNAEALKEARDPK